MFSPRENQLYAALLRCRDRLQRIEPLAAEEIRPWIKEIEEILYLKPIN
jgi:hypothetical protein